MRCKNCGKEIDDFEVFCKECRKELRSISSRGSVDELEELIQEHNDLEKTKELPELSDLKIEEVFEDNNIELEQKEVEDTKETTETREEKFLEKNESSNKKTSKKKLVIIISIIVLIIILSLIVVFLFMKKNNNNNSKEEIIDYKLVINQYGKSIEKTINDYLKENEKVPTWKQVTKLNSYKKHKVTCDVHNIYEDGKIYIDRCKVDNKKIKYSYGKKQKEITKKELSIYKISYEDGISVYTNTNERGSNLVGKVLCNTDNCEYITAFDKYMIVLEDKEYYLYNYENNEMVFGPFNMTNNFDSDNLIVYNNTLYGIYYNEDNVNKIYNVLNDKVLNNISGILYGDDFYKQSSILFKYNYVMLENNGIYNFVNLNTGNVSYTIKGNLKDFIEDKKNKIVYITVYGNNNTNFKIYNSNGKLLFNGKEFSTFKVNENDLVVSTEKNFKVYDFKLNLKKASKQYDLVLDIFDDYIGVINNNYLEIVDLNDRNVATFEEEFDSNYIFQNKVSGWHNESGKQILYIVVENRSVPRNTMGRFVKYYYIKNTNETGKKELSSI